MKKFLTIFIILIAASGMIIAFCASHDQNTITPNASVCSECERILPKADTFILKKNPSVYYAYTTHASTGKKKLAGYILFPQVLIENIDGYAGPIKMIISINEKGHILNLNILSHAETPSYVDSNVVLPEFLEQFISLNARDSFTIGKDIDGISGATISSQAISRIIKESLDIVSQNIFKTEKTANDKWHTVQPRAGINVTKIKARIKAKGLKPIEAKYWSAVKQ